MLLSSDERVSSIIADEQKEEYDARISGIDNWHLFYHLSILRHSLLNWYDFKPDSRILEVGGGFGALTGLLADRAARVDTVEADSLRADGIAIRFGERKNISVYRENIDDFLSPKRYDYIVVVDFLEEYEGDKKKLFQNLRKFLKDDGKLLLGFRNRSGFKYLAGAVDEYVKKPFSNFKNTTPLHTRSEIGELLAETGFPVQKTFYPLPDLSVVHAVYTDEKLPAESAKDRVICYDALSENLSGDTEEMLEKVIKEGSLPDMANAYLIEAGKDEESDIIYAASSTDRGREHGFSTVIYRGGKAVKRPLYPEGAPFLYASFENAEALSFRGLSIVPHEWDDGQIVMPAISGSTAAGRLLRIAEKKEELLSFLDRIWQDILASSDHIELPDHDAERDWGRKAYELGPVLATAYVDMIPYNCFWRRDELLYFDQEFVRKNCPAGYVMYRVLKYMWLYAPKTKQTIDPAYLKERYGVAKLWSKYEEAEDLFTYDNRNCALFEQFFSWAGTSPEDARERAKRRKAFVDSDTAEVIKKEKVRRIQLDLLRVLDEICQKHELRYTAIFGTLLGAVRHKGFVPWDDDIDLAMPREDYDKLIALAPTELPDYCFLQTPESDPGCFYGGYARLRNSNTAALETINNGSSCNQGIWIEIYPLDACGASDKELNKQQRQVFFAQRLMYAKVYPAWTGAISDSDPKKMSLYYIIASKSGHGALCRRLYKSFTSHKKTGWVAVFATYYAYKKNWSRIRERDLDRLIRVPFEDTQIPIPKDYDLWLSERYGKNYMEFPPPESRKSRKDIIYDPDRSYREMTQG